jgi:hypothetical protein
MKHSDKNKYKFSSRKTKQTYCFEHCGSIVLLTIVTAYFIATKGFDYVKDNLIGHPTKELLESEWVKSEYGNPSVVIETPKVLKRIDLTKSLPKEGLPSRICNLCLWQLCR